MNHTPGPWTANGSEVNMATWVHQNNGKRICTMAMSPEDWNNARLIAAAPDLLESLVSLVDWFEQHKPEAAQNLQKARAAIARATGAA